MKRLPPMKRLLNEGEMCPAWYGACYYDHLMRQWVIYPLVVNIIVAAARKLYLFLHRPRWFHSNDSRDAYRQGYMDGKRAAR